MSQYYLTFTFKSDATPGSGDGLPGLIDREIVHDQYGMPYVRGRTIKGLISEEADNILFALEQQAVQKIASLWQARTTLFGDSGSSPDVSAAVHYGRGQLPAGVRDAIVAAMDPDPTSYTGLTRFDILESLTAIRRQTAIEDASTNPDKIGTPAYGSLRAMRVLMRETTLEAELYSDKELTGIELGLLCATIKAWRRAGTGRNRGRGRLSADLLDASRSSILDDGFAKFKAEVYS